MAVKGGKRTFCPAWPGQWKGGKPIWFEQVWFAGDHSDIGGSYAEDESRLSDIALEWMIDSASEVGLLYDPSVLRCYPDATALQHDQSKSSIFRFARRRTRATMREAPLHPSVLERFAVDEVLHYDVMVKYRPEGLKHHNKVKHYYPEEARAARRKAGQMQIRTDLPHP